MFNRKIIISGFVSSVMLAATSFATPASAAQVSFNLDIGIENLLNELIAPKESIPKVHTIDYRGVPIRKIHRKMRRRGLYPVSEYRLRGNRVIIRAEDDYGTLFRVIANANYGNIIRIKRVREESRRRRAPVEQPFYDDGYDNYRPGYDRPTRRNKQRYNNTHAERKARKDAAARALKKRRIAGAAKARALTKRRIAGAAKARALTKRKRANGASLSPAQRKARKARRTISRGNRDVARPGVSKKRHEARLKAARDRKAAKSRADNARRARQARADRNRRAGAQSAPRSKKPYIGLTPKQYKEQQFGGGK